MMKNNTLHIGFDVSSIIQALLVPFIQNVFKNLRYSISHKKNSETVRLRDLSFFFLVFHL